jgi:hypothetical protein
MDRSPTLLTRRDQLVEQAQQTIAPLKAWWAQFGVPLHLDTPSSYFNGRIYTLLLEFEEATSRLAGQHPRFVTEKQLKAFEEDYTRLPQAWWLLREARLFESVRPKVKPTSLDLPALLGEIHRAVHGMSWVSRDVREAKPDGGCIPELAGVVEELAFLADLSQEIKKSAEAVAGDYRPTSRRASARPPLAPDHRFKLEHDLLYLKFLEAHAHQLKTQFFAVYTPLATLTTRITEALLDWRGILGLLEESPLSAYAWHCHRDLEALAGSRDLSLAELQSAYEMTHMAVQEAFEAQFQRRHS